MKRNIEEARVASVDVKDIFNKAVDLRNKPSFGSSIFKNLKKDKIELSDLHKAWRDEGFPDDTSEIASILQDNFGYSPSEIKKVFTAVLGKPDKDDNYYDSEVTEPIINLSNFIKKNNFEEHIKKMLQKEFADDIGISKNSMTDKIKSFFSKKLVSEEIRNIFSLILEEKRESRDYLIMNLEKNNFGRTKK